MPHPGSRWKFPGEGTPHPPRPKSGRRPDAHTCPTRRGGGTCRTRRGGGSEAPRGAGWGVLGAGCTEGTPGRPLTPPARPARTPHAHPRETPAAGPAHGARGEFGVPRPLPLRGGSAPSLCPLRLSAWEPGPRGGAARPLPSPRSPRPPSPARPPRGTPKPGAGGAPTCSEPSPGRTRASEAPGAPRGHCACACGGAGRGLGTRYVGPARADVTASVSRAPGLPGRRQARRN